jgi:hypothetical protein
MPPGTPPGYGSAPGYGAPMAGYGAVGPVKTNGLAIGSLIASLVGFLCGLGSIVGIILGIVALNQIKARGEGGRGLAIAGIVIGAISLLVGILVAVAFVAAGDSIETYSAT